MIDLHVHILPGIDDGPRTAGESVLMARAARAAGTTTVVATPHIDARHGLGPDDVEAGVAALRDVLAVQQIDLEVLVGGEIAVERLDGLDDTELERLGLGRGRHLLIECPLSLDFGAFDARVLDLRAQGRPVLLAHPERSPGFQREPDRLVRLVEAGARCSVTAGAVAGRFGRTVRAFALALLRHGLVHNLSSDAHDVVRRPPDLRDAIADLGGVGGHGIFTWMTVDVPAAIVEGREPPATPRPPAPPA